MININTLKKYADANLNVLFTGLHGVGKTAIIKEVFNDKFGPINKSWRYFSASTLDPWVDLIGIPKNYTNDSGKEVFRIVPPEDFTGDEKIEAIFFDEINRADEKTLNAVMELIQFRSINGRKFPHLKCIWAAENPGDDDENDYSVRDMDPAQRDRFQIQLSIPYELNEQYFVEKFGREIYALSSAWWIKGDVRKKVSPRKLDDMLSGYMQGFDIADFTNVIDTTELSRALSSVDVFASLINVAKSGDVEKIKSIFTLDNIRKNEIILNTKANKNKIFDNVYSYVDGEIKDYISKTFKYTYVENREESSLTDAQMKIINRNSDPIDFNFNNIDKVIETVKEINENFKLNDVYNDLIDADSLNKLYPFVFDSDNFRSNSSHSKIVDYVNEKSIDISFFIDYFCLLAKASERIREELGENDTVENINTFLEVFYDNTIASRHLNMAVIQMYNTYDLLKKGKSVPDEMFEKIRYKPKA